MKLAGPTTGRRVQPTLRPRQIKIAERAASATHLRYAFGIATGDGRGRRRLASPPGLTSAFENARKMGSSGLRRARPRRRVGASCSPLTTSARREVDHRAGGRAAPAGQPSAAEHHRRGIQGDREGACQRASGPCGAPGSRGATLGRLKVRWADRVPLQVARSVLLVGWPGLRIHTTVTTGAPPLPRARAGRPSRRPCHRRASASTRFSSWPRAPCLTTPSPRVSPTHSELLRHREECFGTNTGLLRVRVGNHFVVAL